MCINCNLVAPLQHDMCELLGVPKNTYGVVSNTFDIIEHLLIDIQLSIKYGDVPSISQYKPKDKETLTNKLYQYLKDNNLFHHIDNMLKDVEYSSVVDRSFINYVLVKYFEIDWNHDPTDDVVDNFAVPIELLTINPKRLRECIGKTTFKQLEMIPDELIEKYKITDKKAIQYELVMLPEQKYYTLLNE